MNGDNSGNNNPQASNLQDETNKFVKEDGKNDGSNQITSENNLPPAPVPDIQKGHEIPVVAENANKSETNKNVFQSENNHEKKDSQENATIEQNKPIPSLSNLMDNSQTPPSSPGNVPSMKLPNPPTQKKGDNNLPSNVPSASVTIEEKKGSKSWKFFVLLSIIIILVIYGAIAYLYFGNQKLKKNSSESSEVITPAEETVTPTPSFSPNQIKILNGNVIRVVSSSADILVNKNDIESTGITGFSSVTVSPDNNNLCIESWSPSPKPALYISGVDGSSLTEVSSNKIGCTWSPDSKSVFYTNSASDINSTDIYAYFIDSDTEVNLTRTSVTHSATRRFSIVGFSADESKLICSYEDVGSEEGVGNCEIDINDQILTYQD